MRDLKDFTAGDWVRLLPVTHAVKQARNDVVLGRYLKARPAALDTFLANTSHLKGKNVANVIAFGQPWVLDFFLKLAERNLTDTTVLVFDNSRQASERTQIERVCREHKAFYFSLPHNPTKHANRSHGLAMTWAFHNVVRAIQPAIFSFIDHDMIPVEQLAFADRLGAQPFFGRLILSKWAWSLWAGYCIYNFSVVKDLPLNFLYDFSRGLDTGGRNWKCLYKQYARESLKFADFERLILDDGSLSPSRKPQLVDRRWLHLAGVSYNDNFRRNQGFISRVADMIIAGANCDEILAEFKPSN